MEKVTHLSELTKFSLPELPGEYQSLVEEAKLAFQGSYAPYSKFPVGAAVLLQNGAIVRGSNQENAAYPSGLCAERTALFYTGSQYPGEMVKAIAVTVANPINDFPFPCGGCLQVMSETEDRQTAPVDVIMVHSDLDEVLLSRGVNNLLPFAFKKKYFGK